MVTNFLRGRSDLNPVYAASLKWAQEVEAERLTEYRLYQDYYDGEHDVRVPEKMRQVLSPYLEIRDNFIEVIVDALAERLTVTGFAANQATLAARAWELWQVNDLDEVSDDVHVSAILKGDGFVMVDFDDVTGNPRVRYQPPETIQVEYEDDSNTILYRAAKRWTFAETDENAKTRLKTRLNVYYADRVEKYVSTGSDEGSSSFVPYRSEGDTEWPVPWVDSAGEPLGVPLFHFKPRARGDVYGRSEIANAIPQQDALNKLLVDLLVVADTQGFPQRWVAGAKAPAGGFMSGPGIVWRFDNPQAQAGQFEQASLEHLLSSIAMLVNHIAARSRTPQHLFSTTGTYPSGEALKTAEAGLVSKARRRMTAFGNVWEDVLLYMLRLDNVFGQGRSWNLDNPGLVVQWGDPETRNELLHTQAVMLKSPVIGKRQTLRELGYSEQDVDRITKELEAEEKAKASLGNALLDSFMQNQSPPDMNPAQTVGADQATNADEPDTTQPPRFSNRQ